MTFQISPLKRAAFAPLFDLSDAALRARGAVRRIADSKPGFPCRISLQDAEPGEAVILVHYEHQTADSPFRSAHAVYVRPNAAEAALQPGEVPKMLRLRPLSLRAFDAQGMMTGADLADGRAVEGVIETLLADPQAAYLHAHFAKPGCYAARIDRA